MAGTTSTSLARIHIPLQAINGVSEEIRTINIEPAYAPADQAGYESLTTALNAIDTWLTTNNRFFQPVSWQDDISGDSDEGGDEVYTVSGGVGYEIVETTKRVLRDTGGQSSNP